MQFNQIKDISNLSHSNLPMVEDINFSDNQI